jgi:uncharacterized membrane protein YphA (DoxX/SURF4 family)
MLKHKERNKLSLAAPKHCYPVWHAQFTCGITSGKRLYFLKLKLSVMAQSHYLPRWMYSYSTVFFTLFRALLGLLLFVKGIYFVFNHQHLGELIEQTAFSRNSDLFAYVISIAHLLGGAFISLGLLTRIAIILQLPVLLAAVIFNMQLKTSSSVFELFLALFILVLLIYFLIKGPGSISMDAYRKTGQI